MVPPLHMCELGTADSNLGECRKASISALGEGGSGGRSEGDQKKDRRGARVRTVAGGGDGSYVGLRAWLGWFRCKPHQ